MRRPYSLTHLLFFDNVLLFCYGNEIYLKKLLKLLDIFWDGTDMEVNYNKFSHYFHNINMVIFHALDTFCPFKNMELGEVLKYLGL